MRREAIRQVSLGVGILFEGCLRVAWSVIAWQRHEGHPSFFLQALQTDFPLSRVEKAVFLQPERSLFGGKVTPPANWFVEGVDKVPHDEARSFSFCKPCNLILA